MKVIVRNTREEDFQQIVGICGEVYPHGPSWTPEALASHLRIFPEGQLVAVLVETGEVGGMAAGLVVRWDDYDPLGSWRDFTDRGLFTNHDSSGRTFYGAEVMVCPSRQGYGVGSRLYEERRELVERLGLKRIRAGSRLRGFHQHADRLTPQQYVREVIAGRIHDPTLSFQLNRDFCVIQVIPNYLRRDPESLGNAALIEWLNPKVASPEDYRAQQSARNRLE